MAKTNTKSKPTAAERGVYAPDYDDLLTANLWDEILPNLWQGGTHDDDVIGNSRFAKPFVRQDSFITVEDFDTVITMYQYANPVGWFVKEMRYCVYDSTIEQLDLDELFAVVRYAHSEWKRGQRVLIRCQAGLNRSSLVTALVLMRDGMSAEEAISLIREKRNQYCLFNKDFEKFLLAFDPKRIQD